MTKAALAPPNGKKVTKKTIKKPTKQAPKPSGAVKKTAANKAVAAKKAAPQAAAEPTAPAKKIIKAAAKAYRAQATSVKKAKK